MHAAGRLEGDGLRGTECEDVELLFEEALLVFGHSVDDVAFDDAAFAVGDVEHEEVGVDFVDQLRDGHCELAGADDDGGVFAFALFEGAHAVLEKALGGVVHGDDERAGDHVADGFDIFLEVFGGCADAVLQGDEPDGASFGGDEFMEVVDDVDLACGHLLGSELELVPMAAGDDPVDGDVADKAFAGEDSASGGDVCGYDFVEGDLHAEHFLGEAGVGVEAEEVEAVEGAVEDVDVEVGAIGEA